jgi:IS30 family transposase
MTKIYQHISCEERAVIMMNDQQGVKAAHIAKILGRDRSAVTRELNHQPKGQYCATKGAELHRQRKAFSVKPKKLISNEKLSDKVNTMIQDRQWSPEQISEKLKLDYPDDPSMRVSHETIYRHIYAIPKNELRKLFVSNLRQAKTKRGRRRSSSSSATIQVTDSQTIHCRPEEIEDREIAGHWEGDLIIGAHNRSSIGTVVERKTGFVFLSKMKSKSAEDVRAGFERQFKKIDQFLRLSMTYDRGSEMADHALMSEELSLDIYFADPHSPWQRGSNENTNGLLRQYFPKGTDLSVHSQKYLNEIAWILNTRPRKRHKYKTPQELFDKEIDTEIKRVALAS